MAHKFTDLHYKEVICICDGRRLGFVSDAIIELPEGCERIGSRAFAESATLKVVLIPGSVTQISADAFDGCAEDLVILTDEGSAAHMLAAQNGMLFVIR